MKVKGLLSFALLFVLVSFSYGTAEAQVVDAVKDAASKTKEVTVDAAKKTADVTGDIAEGTKDVTVKAAKKTAGVTKDVAGATKDGTVKAAKKTADVTADAYDKADDVAASTYDKADDMAYDVAQATAKGTKKSVYFVGDKAVDLGKYGYKGGKWVTMTTWDGMKWVSKKARFWAKEGYDKTEDALN